MTVNTQTTGTYTFLELRSSTRSSNTESCNMTTAASDFVAVIPKSELTYQIDLFQIEKKYSKYIYETMENTSTQQYCTDILQCL